MTEYVAIPKVLLRDLQEGLVRVEEVLATLEGLAGEEYKKGEYITIQSSDEIRNEL